MQINKMDAWEIENNDFLVINGEVKGYVYSIDDTGDEFVFDVVDDDGEHEEISFPPFAVVSIVSSFEEE